MHNIVRRWISLWILITLSFHHILAKKGSSKKLRYAIRANSLQSVRDVFEKTNASPPNLMKSRAANGMLLRSFRVGNIAIAQYLIVAQSANVTADFIQRLNGLYNEKSKRAKSQNQRNNLQGQFNVLRFLQSYRKLIAFKDPRLLCLNEPCKHGGSCHNKADLSGFSCECASRFRGKTCELASICHTKNKCQNGGTCENTDTGKGFICICTKGFTGTLCGTSIVAINDTPTKEKPLTKVPELGSNSDDILLEITVKSKNKPKKGFQPTISLLGAGKNRVETYQILDDDTLNLHKTYDLPYSVKGDGMPVIVYNPDYDALEFLGDSNDGNNMNHGWLSIDTGTYTSTNVDRFEGRKFHAAVYTPKLGTLVIGGHKPYETYTACARQITTPRGKYDQFLYMPNLERGRINTAAVNYNDKVFVAGGSDPYMIMNFVEILDLTKYKIGEELDDVWWESLKPMSEVTEQLSLQTVDNIMYSVGGFRMYQSIEGYNMDTNKPMGSDSRHYGKSLVAEHRCPAVYANRRTGRITVIGGGLSNGLIESSRGNNMKVFEERRNIGLATKYDTQISFDTFMYYYE